MAEQVQTLLRSALVPVGLRSLHAKLQEVTRAQLEAVAAAQDSSHIFERRL